MVKNENQFKVEQLIMKEKEIKELKKRGYDLSKIDLIIKESEIKELKKKRGPKSIDRIKKVVLELGVKFARLQIAEISEVCNIDDVQLIVDTVKDMVKNREIYAQYFSSTKSVAFDQQANIEEIDKLMNTYKNWEDKEIGKK